MDLALCYESVLPQRGGCETYIADLSRRLVADGHTVHVYAARWDAASLPAGLRYHQLPAPRGPRFLRPWRFAAACVRALRTARHDLSIGFNKTWGQDVLYPQAGLHVATAEHNLLKHRSPIRRGLAGFLQRMDLAQRSYRRLERRQYLGAERPIIVANSQMVRWHFQSHYGIDPETVRVVHSAVDPSRFIEDDRPRRRLEWRQRFGIRPEETVGLFLAMNYQLKGLEPLLWSLRRVPREQPFRLVVAGGRDWQPYARLARRLKVDDRVCFAGFCAEARNIYFAADFLVHPTFYDPCSLVVLEALACGLPVITSRYNGAAELLRPPHDGYVVTDPHDHEHLAWCMTQLLDPARRVASTQALRRRAGQWTFDHHYRQLMSVLCEAAAHKCAA